jgi:asparagine synthase (glutamine-hydrolysing)
MCGIVCLFDAKQKTETLRPQILEMSKKLDTEDQIGAVFFNQKKQFFLTKD